MIHPFALAWIKRIEGGFVDHPSDSGGPTIVGLTVPALIGIDDDGNGRLDYDIDGDGDVDADDIRALAALPEAERDAKIAAYYDRVWRAVAGSLPWPASLLAFDGAVHHGQRPGVIVLQKALSVRADGVVGNETLRAASLASLPDLSRAYQAERDNLFRMICNQRAKDRDFLLGWLNRAAMLREQIWKV